MRTRAARHEDLPGWGPSPARHKRIKAWAAAIGLRQPNGAPLPQYEGAVPAWIEQAYVKATGDTEGQLKRKEDR